MKKVFLGLLICLPLFSFLFLRVFRISTSLEFFSDIGRDHYALWLWSHTHKPPLLGPGTSFFPLNQSPLYYYLNYPVFILSGMSPYTTIITIISLFVAVYAMGVYLSRRNRFWLNILFILGFLVTLHPQFILQQRYPWNPSFAAFFLLLCVVSLLTSLDSYSKKKVWFFALGAAGAIGCSYSVFPTVLVLTTYALWKFRKHMRTLLVSLVTTFLVVFAPIIFFELRHNFFFFHRLFSENAATSSVPVQYGKKLIELWSFVLGVYPTQYLLMLGVGALTCISIYITFSRPRKTRTEHMQAVVSVLFVLSFLLTYIPPLVLYSHYIFGVTVLFFFFVATMKKRLMIPLVCLLLISWLSSSRFQEYFMPARRTIQTLTQCAQLVCANEKEPIYVSSQGWYNFHFANDHLFFFNTHGCSARDITQDPGFAHRMAVVVDQSEFTYGKTSFNELTLFGPSKLATTYSCKGNISVIMIDGKKD